MDGIVGYPKSWQRTFRGLFDGNEKELERFRRCQVEQCQEDLLDPKRSPVGGYVLFARVDKMDFPKYGGCCPRCYEEKSRIGLTAKTRGKGRRRSRK